MDFRKIFYTAKYPVQTYLSHKLTSNMCYEVVDDFSLFMMASLHPRNELSVPRVPPASPRPRLRRETAQDGEDGELGELGELALTQPVQETGRGRILHQRCLALLTTLRDLPSSSFRSAPGTPLRSSRAKFSRSCSRSPSRTGSEDSGLWRGEGGGDVTKYL